jgi:hypothetical protein
VEFDKVLVTPSGFVPGAGESSCIWNQGEAKGLNRVPQANTITFRVESVILRTPMYTNGFVGVPFCNFCTQRLNADSWSFGTSPFRKTFVFKLTAMPLS